MAFFIMTKNQIPDILNQLYEASKEALHHNEVPVSAVLLLKDGRTIVSRNHVEEQDDPFSHAEYDVIRQGMKEAKSRYLKDCILFISLEPCLFCLGAILKAGIKDIYYVLDDEKLGSLSHYHVYVDDKLHIHRIDDERFKPLFTEFFKKIR